ncbi:MAG: flagellar basal body rod protein FlgB [Alphaproteobacteria bacterium]|nr:flagellar basal body rod protein FlgB [Alphaproteobacteria bacterium]
MDLTKLPLFTLMAKRLSWLGERQQVLANNVANADTPGYRARDLKALSFKKVLGGEGAKLGMAATNAAHLAGQSRKPAANAVEKTDSHEIVISGNSVSLEEEMMKVGKTMMDYQLTINLYRKHLSMIKTALGRGN